LREVVPAELPGWTVRDGRVAETEEMKRAVGELLNFDDVVLRTYRQGGREFEIYAAYWRPGKMAPRLVAGHTPDVCWVAAGWMVRERVSQGPRAGAPGLATPAQFRVFAGQSGAVREVWFWHRSGDESVDYAAAGAPPWWAIFSDLARHGLDQRRSQHFVRLSANVPFAELVEEPGFLAALAALRPIVDGK
jgi:hypothetical protein